MPAEHSMDLQLAVFAFETDMIDAEQLLTSLQVWAVEPERSILELLVRQLSLSEVDLQLLRALWERADKNRASSPQHADATCSFDGASRSGEFSLHTGFEGHRNGKVVSDHDLDAINSRSRFVIERFVAAGGIGKVSLGIDQALNRRVALKEILPQFKSDPIARCRFLREAEITGCLEHPAIVPVYHYGETANDQPFYCMRWIDGQNLRDRVVAFHAENVDHGLRLEGFDSVPFRKLIQSLITVCRATAHAHARDIIHRDIKPANILVGEHDETVLVDWGLAKRMFEDDSPLSSTCERSNRTEVPSPLDVQTSANEVSSDSLSGDDGTPFRSTLTMQGTALGTPAYMSPEVARGESATSASDIFCLGATLYFIVTGQAPYVGKDVVDVLAVAQKGNFLSPKQVCPDVPVVLDAICRTAMALLPSDRYSSANELADELECWLADQPVKVWVEPIWTRTRRSLRRHPSLTAASVVLIVAATVGSWAYSAITTAANHELQLANQRATQASQLANTQSELALASLEDITYDIQRSLKHIPAAQQVRSEILETALQGLQRVAKSLENRGRIDHGSLIAHRDLGSVFLEVGDIGQTHGISAAREQYKRAYTIASQLASAPEASIEDRRQLAVCLQSLGYFESKVGSTELALQHYQESLTLLNQLNLERADNREILRSLADSHDFLGTLLLQAAKTEEAGDHFSRALKIHESLLDDRDPDSLVQRSWIVAVNKVGEYHMRVGQLTEARQYLMRGLEASQLLASKTPEDVNILRDVSVAHNRLARLAEVSGDGPTAVEHYRESLSADELRLRVDPANALNQRDCVESNWQLADALIRLGNKNEAAEHLRKAIVGGESMVAANPQDKSVLRSIAYAHSSLGDLLIDHDGEAALEHFRECLSSMERAAALDSSNPRSHSDIAFGLSKLGDGYLHAGRVDDAMECFTRALPLHELRYRHDPKSIAAIQNLATFHLQLAQALAKQGKSAEAREHYESSLEVALQGTASAPEHVRLKIVLITILDSFADFETTMHERASAKERLQHAMKLARGLEELGKLVGDDAKWISSLSVKLDAIEN